MKLNRRLQMKALTALGTAALIALAALPPGASVAHADKAIVSSSTPLYGTVSAPAAKPLWSLQLMTFKQDGAVMTAALAESGRVFALVKGGQLAAYDGASGKQLWKYGTALRPLLVYNQGTVFGLTKDGAIYALGTDGSRKWTAAIHADKAASIEPIGGMVYVTENLTLYALERATGKLLWKHTETSGEYEGGLTGITEDDGVVLRNYMVQGALSSTQINAYDKMTGKQLWTSFRQSPPLAVKDGLVYSVTDTFMAGDNDPVHKTLHIAVMSLKTGALKGDRVYGWNAQPANPGEYRFGGAYGSAFLDGSDLYVFQDQGVAKYDFAAYSPGGKPMQRWAAPDPRDYGPLYRVHNGRLLYQGFDDRAIEVLKTSTGQILRFPNGIQPVQTDLYGNGLFVAKADGTLDAYDFAAVKPVFSLKTGSRDFESTLKSGAMLYVRSGGTLHAVKLPANLS
ncbi:PQQ-binding-like beta-propeller repeat protein [Paenibacillus sacheonensis]|uniref:PQQ-binding-like beta-propeller repeat protein n=1 Tax=Paenibacillus sacheonensis TaxID=742054 RepID=A0A7X4YS98_9BACL|nr:PQQ-binding-like beta-propeller repeat protein [Paenibacillus sacheonensis]MBM7566667.1 outer membrane protein assembly factor BamB [Paenibacillus sacheonensis]NBC70649.1 PQQ-binding-like beta-propeller repeat protein [Paenibacillus sacheonensis]